MINNKWLLETLMSVRFDLMVKCDSIKHQYSIKIITEMIDRVTYELSKYEPNIKLPTEADVLKRIGGNE